MITCDNFSTSGEGNITDISLSTNISFNINFEWLNWNLLPNYYRKIKNFTLINCLLEPLKSFWNFNFLKYREETLKELRVTGQKIVLESYLRRKYNNCSIQIINNFSTVSLQYIYTSSETAENNNFNTYLYQKGETPTSNQLYIYNKSETSPQSDFEVIIPQDLINQGVTVAEIGAIVDRYKALGVKYIIKIQ